jgi:hypothetical protein
MPLARLYAFSLMKCYFINFLFPSFSLSRLSISLVCLSVNKSGCLLAFLYLRSSVHLFISLSNSLICLPDGPCIYLSAYPSIYLSVNLFIRQCDCLFVHLSICLSVHPVCLSVHPSVCLIVQPSVCLFACPSVCLFFRGFECH